MVIGQPCLTHHSIPGESRSFALSRFWSVILSPGATSASAAPPPSRHASASRPTAAARQPNFFAMVGLLSSWGKTLIDGCYTRSPFGVNRGRPARRSGRSPADWCASVDRRRRGTGERLEDELLVVLDVPADQHHLRGTRQPRIHGGPGRVRAPQGDDERIA